ncbi:MAG TPA: GPR1/FUN34/YaaH family transporter [Gaiellaceae bacterium]|nr:GPR1/FUN34/YaaH family transporter [Gaiellaceae bacterium]
MPVERTRINVRPMATPLPITFLGLMMATTVVAGLELGIVPEHSYHEVGWAIVAVPVPMQLLAAAWGFVTRSAAATTGSAVLAATWFGVGLTTITGTYGKPGPDPALGLLLLGSAAALTVPMVAEIRVGSLLPAVVMGMTAARFMITGIDGFEHTHAWTTASGYAGFVLAFVALYGAAALELEGSSQDAILPVFRTGRSQRGMEIGLSEQLDEVEHEAGVRKTL